MKKMSCRYFPLWLLTVLLNLPGFAQQAKEIKLKDYHPVSIYKTKQVIVQKARYPVIDFHSHDYPKTDAAVDAWVKTMDATGIAKTMILSYTTGAAFDSIVDKYKKI